ncbi:MAG: DinB family protein, partial [Gemmatimonadaceae bacterium]
MHPRIQEVLDYITAERTVLRAAVDGVPRDRRQHRPAPERWSVAEVLEHLAVVESRVAHLFAMLLAEARANGLAADPETSPVVPTLDMRYLLDRENVVVAPEVLHPRAGLDADAAWSALERSRDALRAAVLAGDGLALGTITRPHP